MSLIPIPFLLLSAVTDWRRRRIYNTVTYPLILMGLLLHGIHMHDEPLSLVLVSIVLTSFVFSTYKGCVLAGGDIKMMLGCLLFLSPERMAVFLMWGIVLAAVWGMGTIMRRKGSVYLYHLLKSDVLSGGSIPSESVSLPGGPLILTAYILTIAAGVSL